MSVLRSTCMVVAMMGLAAEFARVALPATWSWFQAEKILAADASRQRQLDIVDPELEMMRGIMRVPTPASGEHGSIVVAGSGR